MNKKIENIFLTKLVICGMGFNKQSMKKINRVVKIIVPIGLKSLNYLIIILKKKKCLKI